MHFSGLKSKGSRRWGIGSSAGCSGEFAKQLERGVVWAQKFRPFFKGIEAIEGVPSAEKDSILVWVIVRLGSFLNMRRGRKKRRDWGSWCSLWPWWQLREQPEEAWGGGGR